MLTFSSSFWNNSEEGLNDRPRFREGSSISSEATEFWPNRREDERTAKFELDNGFLVGEEEEDEEVAVDDMGAIKNDWGPVGGAVLVRGSAWRG